VAEFQRKTFGAMGAAGATVDTGTTGTTGRAGVGGERNDCTGGELIGESCFLLLS